MAERPILFSAPMVRAILDGTKTQTRRVVQLADGETIGSHDRGLIATHGSFSRSRHCPYGVPGDTLWVRERCWIWGRWTRNGITKTGRQKWRFRAEPERRVRFDSPDAVAPRKAPDGQDGPLGWVLRLPRFMPRWASRITLEVVGVRVERLQEISDADAFAEGSARGVWTRLWDSINADRAPWSSNPWVWAVEFKRATEAVNA